MHCAEDNGAYDERGVLVRSERGARRYLRLVQAARLELAHLDRSFAASTGSSLRTSSMNCSASSRRMNVSSVSPM